jgi:antitoxin HigA-1
MEHNRNFTATHPGEVIKDELIARGITQKEFAGRIDVPYTMLNDILNERRPLSASTALLIESALGISADLLMGLQSDYTMQQTRNNAEVMRKVRNVRPFTSTAVFPR